MTATARQDFIDSVIIEDSVNTFDGANMVQMDAVELRIAPLLRLT